MSRRGVRRCRRGGGRRGARRLVPARAALRARRGRLLDSVHARAAVSAGCFSPTTVMAGCFCKSIKKKSEI